MKSRKTSTTEGLVAVVHHRLVRLSSFMAEVAASVFLLGGNQRAVEEHVNSGPRVFIQSGCQATKQTVKPISNLANLLPKQKRVEIVHLVDALPANPNRLNWSVGVDALLEKLKGRKVCIMGRINACDLPQLIKKPSRLLVGNIS